VVEVKKNTQYSGKRLLVLKKNESAQIIYYTAITKYTKQAFASRFAMTSLKVNRLKYRFT